MKTAVLLLVMVATVGCGSSGNGGAKDAAVARDSTTGSAGTGGGGTGGRGGTGGSAGTGGGGMGAVDASSGGGGAAGGGAGGSAAVDASRPVDAGASPDAAAAPDVRPPDASASPDAPVAPDAAIATDGPAQTTGGVIFQLVDQSAGMTMATDANGVLHVAASTVVDASGKYMAAYARCPGKCSDTASWSAVTLAEVSTGHVPTIALTQDGRPRITYYVAVGAAPGLHYLECDANCLATAGWKDVRLSDHLAVTPYPRPRLPFAVSPGGVAAFSYDDGTGLQLLLCKSACGQVASWTRSMIAGVFILPESLAFATDQSLQLVARQRMLDTESLMFLDCAAGADCTSAQSWDGVAGLWRTTMNGVIEAQLARTAQGGSRIVLYADDPNTPKTERIFAYLTCDAQCRMPASWKVPLLPPIAPGTADVGWTLALDSGGRPVIAYADIGSSSVARCTGDCTTTAGLWQSTPAIAATDLNRGFPITVPATCVSAAWSMYTGPALTLAADKPMVAMTAASKAFGGQCGNGSTAIETNSFVLLP